MDDGLYDHESLIHKPLWNKMIVILAGVAMNFLLAGIIFSIAFWVGVKPLAINSKLPTNIETKLIPTIEQAVEKKMLLVDGIELSPLIGGPASQAGMKDRDRLITIDGLIMKTPESMVQYIASSKESIRFEVLRDDKKVAFTVTPKE
jgi:membrane-associated protease RseP (regulator of RpoE activity)